MTRVHTGFVVWLTGLPASGKTTTAKALQNKLYSIGLKSEILDGDQVRKAISPELGFSKADRELHAKRVAYISHLLSRNGIIVIVSLISPLRSFRDYAREVIGNFVEVWVKCSIEECNKRDPKGLYKNAFQGKISNLTGIQDPYEPPLKAEVVIDTEKQPPNECIERIMNCLNKLKYI
jgi:adenylylsulfate kinase